MKHRDTVHYKLQPYVLNPSSRVLMIIPRSSHRRYLYDRRCKKSWACPLIVYDTQSFTAEWLLQRTHSFKPPCRKCFTLAMSELNNSVMWSCWMWSWFSRQSVRLGLAKARNVVRGGNIWWHELFRIASLDLFNSFEVLTITHVQVWDRKKTRCWVVGGYIRSEISSVQKLVNKIRANIVYFMVFVKPLDRFRSNLHRI